jgi:hypothetical protein
LNIKRQKTPQLLLLARRLLVSKSDVHALAIQIVDINNGLNIHKHITPNIQPALAAEIVLQVLTM